MPHEPKITETAPHGAEAAQMAVECVWCDRAGAPKRRRLTPLLALIRHGRTETGQGLAGAA